MAKPLGFAYLEIIVTLGLLILCFPTLGLLRSSLLKTAKETNTLAQASSELHNAYVQREYDTSTPVTGSLVLKTIKRQGYVLEYID